MPDRRGAPRKARLVRSIRVDLPAHAMRGLDGFAAKTGKTFRQLMLALLLGLASEADARPSSKMLARLLVGPGRRR